MSVAELKSICDERQIKKIGIVDDVFDVPSPSSLDRVRFSDFREKFNADSSLRRAVAWSSGQTADKLPAFDDLEEDNIAPLWKAVWKQQLGGRRLKSIYADALHNLFVEHGDSVLEVLDTIADLYSLFSKDLERVVNVYGRDEFDASEIAEAQIILLDYFLGQNLSEEDALELALDVVKEVVEAARLAKRPVPSFLLVSDRQDEIDIETFRTRAELMKSRFRFFSKDKLRADHVENMVNLHDLIDASDRTEKIEQLIKDWQRGANEAISAVHERILTLDVSDLVYLDCFRLAHEGTSIGDYLRWFLTASLNARVTGELNNTLWQEADALKLYSVTDEGGHVDQKTLLKTLDGPSDALAHAYGDILFDETRGTGKLAFPSQLSPHDLVEGDLFVHPKGKKKEFANAEVQLVLTPSCDLIQRIPNQPPEAKSVLLLSGYLRRADLGDGKANLSEIDFLRLREHGQWGIFLVEWNYLHPISINWTVLSKYGPGKGYQRLGRVRDLYFHRVREKFVNRFTRIGTAVAPLLPQPRSGEVMILVQKAGKKRYKSVMDFSSEDRYVWEIGPVLVTRPNKRPEKKSVYQTSRKFINELNANLHKLHSDPDLTDAAKLNSGHLKNMHTYMDLLRPMIPGPRGENDVVDVKKVTKRDNKNIRSQADLLILTFLD